MIAALNFDRFHADPRCAPRDGPPQRLVWHRAVARNAQAFGATDLDRRRRGIGLQSPLREFIYNAIYYFVPSMRDRRIFVGFKVASALALSPPRNPATVDDSRHCRLVDAVDGQHRPQGRRRRSKLGEDGVHRVVLLPNLELVFHILQTEHLLGGARHVGTVGAPLGSILSPCCHHDCLLFEACTRVGPAATAGRPVGRGGCEARTAVLRRQPADAQRDLHPRGAERRAFNTNPFAGL
mmetsp:Transcript_13618/g.41433  ORF Transcript_13618/g.41433 Transcript_13618/m.41433 type:complete len:238 (-) Transcript_13618:1727-2440(-)